MADIHAWYLQDLGALLRERAVEARDRAAAVRSESSLEAAFDVGYCQAYWEVLSLMLQQAHTFELPLGDVGLVGCEPDCELVPPTRQADPDTAPDPAT